MLDFVLLCVCKHRQHCDLRVVTPGDFERTDVFRPRVCARFFGFFFAEKGLRNTRHSSVAERLQVVNGLGKKADEMCRHLMTHLDKVCACAAAAAGLHRTSIAIGFV